MINELCRKLHFPEEAIFEMEKCHQILMADEKIQKLLLEAQESFLSPEGQEYIDVLQLVADQSGVHRYTVDMVFLLMTIELLRQRYQERNLPEDLMWETMEDLTYNLQVCKDVRGVWGTFALSWFKQFYGCTRFKLGRMEYEIVPYEKDDYRDLVKKGDPVINCHIPASGPLTEEMVLDSLRRAYDFYPEVRYGGKMVCVCLSWILYPPHYAVYPENSNLRRFYELFEVLSSEPNSSNRNFWRIFNKEYDPATLDQMQTDNRLRRNFLKFIKDGNCMGAGFGVLVFDGQKIL